ncbi:MAG: [Oscillospiraceae bacterium]|nr:[FeFe] hydrogenase H-cluster radical SAM maturase HydE [Oscillospiraceae bacterium]
MRALLDKLERDGVLSQQEFVTLIENRNEELAQELFRRARAKREAHYGKDVFIRGLIELTNYCKNDCFYCGIRCSNRNAQRYRLTKEEILDCCREGYGLGYRTFVLQGGEDPWYNPERIEDLVRSIKENHPDCAVTLSVGEHPREVYARWKDAGADRYLLRHETADTDHYRSLHPKNLTLENRMRCLWDLKELGYQVGCGFMVGSPGQTAEHLAKDLLFIHQLQPEMVGIGPFIPHCDTPFRDREQGSLELTLFLLGIVRLMLPKVLLPSTTALGTIHSQGRELGILAGANVCMPNLSPVAVRKKYALYNNKICTGEEAAQSRDALAARMASIGYRVVVSRGDHITKI